MSVGDPPPDRAVLRHSAVHLFVADVDRPEIAAEDEHHVLRVLRLRAGEMVSVTDGAGRWRLCALGSAGVLAPTTEVVVEPPPRPLTIGFAPPKGERPEWAVARLTELGVTRIQPLVAARSVVRWDDERWERQHAKWSSVARQAAMQSRQLWLPELPGPAPVADLLAAASAGGPALAVPGGPPPDEALEAVFVGPEGGWTADEEAAAAARVGLGPGVLRTETAAVVAAALCVALHFGRVRSVNLSSVDHAK